MKFFQEQQTVESLPNLAWKASLLDEALLCLAREIGLSSTGNQLPKPLEEWAESTEGEALAHWFNIASAQLGLEAELTEASYRTVEEMLARAGPAVLRLPGEGEARFLLIVKGLRGKLHLLSPSLKKCRVPISLVRECLCRDLEAPLLGPIGRLLQDAGVPAHRQPHALRSILNEQLSGVPIAGCWVLRLSPSANLFSHLRQARVPRSVIALVAYQILLQLLGIAGWALIVKGALAGHFEWVWFMAWALVLFTSIPLQMAMSLTIGLLPLKTATIFKARMLFGTLCLEPEEIRHQGIGQFMGRIIDTQEFETITISGGFNLFFAAVNFCIASVILSVGSGTWLPAALLLLWTGLALLMSWLLFRSTMNWMSHYREMTNDLIERMVGHRTRLAQDSPKNWHNGEDHLLTRYLELSEKMDRIHLIIESVLPRGWLLVGFASIAYGLVNQSFSAEMIAISLGGILLVERSFEALKLGITRLIQLAVAWDQVGPIFAASKRNAESNSKAILEPRSTPQQGASAQNASPSLKDDPLLVMNEVTFRYNERGREILQACNLKVSSRDRILLEGPSGGGKSTLASLMIGMRTPPSGVLLLKGFDRPTLGLDTWRKHVVMAPQFHENHVLSASFSFNLLMGRSWPPHGRDLKEAEEICRELGLGDLLDRMPAGIHQMIGENGWKLSHGERSRLYIARTLLQKAEVIILDESFAALDPENLQRSLHCVLKRAQTLIVIAHP